MPPASPWSDKGNVEVSVSSALRKMETLYFLYFIFIFWFASPSFLLNTSTSRFLHFLSSIAKKICKPRKPLFPCKPHHEKLQPFANVYSPKASCEICYEPARDLMGTRAHREGLKFKGLASLGQLSKIDQTCACE